MRSKKSSQKFLLQTFGVAGLYSIGVVVLAGLSATAKIVYKTQFASSVGVVESIQHHNLVIQTLTSAVQSEAFYAFIALRIGVLLLAVFVGYLFYKAWHYDGKSFVLDTGHRTEKPAQEVSSDVRRQLDQIARLAKTSYDQFEIVGNDGAMIYYENTADYVDSFLEASSRDRQATSLNIAFTIPPNSENPAWTSYNIKLVNPEQAVSLTRFVEINQNGDETDLDNSYLAWIADTLEVIFAYTTLDERPEQQAPRSMY